MKINFIKIAISISVVALVACEHTQGVAPQLGGLQPTLSSIQDNIITPKCVNQGCHPGSAAPMSLAQGVAFSTLVNVPSGYGNLLRVAPNDFANSVLFLKITGSATTGNRMPLNRSPLEQDEINAIQEWIEDGAQNN